MIGCGVASVVCGALRFSFRVKAITLPIFEHGLGLLMKTFLTAAAVLLGATAAQAADIDAAPYGKAPPLAPVYNWTGFYAGLNVGYGWSDQTVGFAAGDPFIITIISDQAWPALPLSFGALPPS